MLAGYLITTAALGYNAYERSHIERTVTVLTVPPESHNLETILLGVGGAVLCGVGVAGVRRKAKEE